MVKRIINEPDYERSWNRKETVGDNNVFVVQRNKMMPRARELVEIAIGFDRF